MIYTELSLYQKLLALLYLTSVRVNFKLVSRKGSRCEPFLETKIVKASRSEAFTILVYRLLPNPPATSFFSQNLN